MSKASWAGAKMVLHQVVHEAAPLFLLFQAYFQERDFHKLEMAAGAAGVKQHEWNSFIAYAAAFYANLGNYHSEQYRKFIPTMNQPTLKTIFCSNPLFNNENATYKHEVVALWNTSLKGAG